MGVSKKSAAGEDGRDPLKIRIKLEVPEIRAKKIRKSQCGWGISEAALTSRRTTD
jgi:hypothetical protein